MVYYLLSAFFSISRNISHFYEPGKASSSEEEDSRPILAYLNFAPNHNKLRPVALESFKDIGTFVKGKNASEYWEDLKRSKFVVSPPGKPCPKCTLCNLLQV